MRLFLAVDLGGDLRERIHRDAAALREAAPSVAWVRATSLHITVKFLGEVADATLPGLVSAVGEAAARHPVFKMELQGVGAYPNSRRPRIVWLGAVEAGAMASLARDLDLACASLGFPREDREFSAHVTLGRVKQALSPPALRSLTAAADAAGAAYDLLVDAVKVMRSELTPQGSRYTEMASLPLRHG